MALVQPPPKISHLPNRGEGTNVRGTYTSVTPIFEKNAVVSNYLFLSHLPGASPS